MKKGLTIIIAAFLLICAIPSVYAYYLTNDNFYNAFKTKEYSFNINSMGGSYDNTEVIISKDKAILPSLNKEGYEFLGYSLKTEGEVEYNKEISNVNEINGKTIYGRYEPIFYEITYELNGGEITNQKESYNISDEFVLVNPKKEGYVFTGWTGSNGKTPQKDVKVGPGEKGNLYFEAHWEVAYYVDVNPIIENVTYNAGMDGFTFDVYINDELIANQVIDWCEYVGIGSTIKVIANAKNGYALENENVSQVINSDGIVFSPTWSLNIYAINYYPNGGNMPPAANAYTVKDFYTLPTPSAQGYNFLGWTGSNGGTPQTNVTIWPGTTGHLSFWANWEKYNAYNSGGIYLVSYRNNTDWSGTLTGYYNAGDNSVHSGNWLVTVDASCAYITGTIYPKNNYTYQFYVYKANSPTELLATGSASAGKKVNAKATICW